MRKFIVSAIIVLFFCGAALLVAGRHGLPFSDRVRMIHDGAHVSATIAASHPEIRYTAFDSIEHVLGVPNHFARMAALYALASRSDSTAVQSLIFQAHGIADMPARKEILLVLFTRLTELDAASSLALSRTSDFASDPDFEHEVWRRWGVLDLDAALDEAAAFTRSQRNRVAQSLFVAYDNWGNEKTRRIAERLGAQPDRRTRSAHIDGLAVSDPAAAIAYVEELESALQRRQAAEHLGRLLGGGGIEAADRWSAFFHDPMLRGLFEEAAAQSAAEGDPYGTLEYLFADGGQVVTAARLATAIGAVAAEDIEQALLWYERADSRHRRDVGKAIATQLAQADPIKALSWARDNDTGMTATLYMSVLETLAETQPELAVDDARSLDNRSLRMSALIAVADNISERSPERAVALMADIGALDARDAILQRITVNWLELDSDAALNWIISADVPDRGSFMTATARVVSYSDLDAALRLLPRLDSDIAPVWRQEIAANMASQRSVVQAKNFIAQYEGSPDYPSMLVNMIDGLSRVDARAAVEMLEMAVGPDREMLTTNVYMRYVQQTPQDAVKALTSIQDEHERSRITERVVQHWARSDPSAAEQWVGKLSRGTQRDSAVAAISSSWRELTAARRLMIESIEDQTLLKQATANVILRIARLDRDRAEQALRSIDLPEKDREELLGSLNASFQRTATNPSSRL